MTAPFTAFDALKAAGIPLRANLRFAPNPAMMMAQLLAGMKDEDSRVLVPHFYDGIEPLSAAEKEALAHAPVNDHMLMNAFWLGHVDGVSSTIFVRAATHRGPRTHAADPAGTFSGCDGGAR